MADEDDTIKEQEQEDLEAEKTDEKTSGRGISPWIIVFVVVALCGGTASVLSQFLGGYN